MATTHDARRADTGSTHRVRFHGALFARQPTEGSPAPEYTALIETGRRAAVGDSVPDCMNSGKFSEMVHKFAAATQINATSTVRINGENYQPTSPDTLVAKIREITPARFQRHAACSVHADTRPQSIGKHLIDRRLRAA